ncbi:hypothetical protein [Mycolicibacterium fortuitum]|uniref:hypothetical protein n=1 Tax=Mycolicibacterium fortuitum TaxID=1766 RepID=UPI001AEF5FBF|nr:hypothetical protein [Mycolicibacterium fortuitum]MBP3087483.1 hypothetical protein [Mycolicibacterium fortuitum]
MATDLEWFFRLRSNEQFDLLRDPHQDVHGELAQRLFLAKQIVGSEWVSNDGGTHWSLATETASTLSAIRLRLDQWWQNLEADQKAHIIGNRAGELEADYHDVVQAPAYDAITKAPHADMLVVSDDKTGRFTVPRLTRVYVDMKAGEHE